MGSLLVQTNQLESKIKEVQHCCNTREKKVIVINMSFLMHVKIVIEGSWSWCISLQDAISHLVSKAASRRDKSCLAIISTSYFFDCVKILGQQKHVHNILGGCPLDILIKLSYTLFETIHNCLAFLPLQLHSGTWLHCLHFQNFVLLCSCSYSIFESLRSIVLRGIAYKSSNKGKCANTNDNETTESTENCETEKKNTEVEHDKKVSLVSFNNVTNVG